MEANESFDNQPIDYSLKNRNVCNDRRKSGDVQRRDTDRTSANPVVCSSIFLHKEGLQGDEQKERIPGAEQDRHVYEDGQEKSKDKSKSCNGIYIKREPDSEDVVAALSVSEIRKVKTCGVFVKQESPEGKVERVSQPICTERFHGKRHGRQLQLSEYIKEGLRDQIMERRVKHGLGPVDTTPTPPKQYEVKLTITDRVIDQYMCSKIRKFMSLLAVLLHVKSNCLQVFNQSVLNFLR